MMKCRLAVLMAVWCGLSASLLAGELQFGRYYSNGMVLQREQQNLIRGMAPAGASVSVTLAGQEVTTTADETGIWSVMLDPLPATMEPQVLSVRADDKSVSLRDVVVGDVFLLAQQTSIDISLGQTPEGQAAAAQYKVNPGFRAISIQTIPSTQPRQDLAAEATTGWKTVSPESARTLSAAAYYLGYALAREMEVPVGIVDLNLGSTFPVSWLSREALEQTETLYGKSDVPGQIKRFDNLVDLDAKGEPMPRKEIVTSDFASYAIFPSGGYNAVLHPLRGLAVKALLVQLGNDYPYMIYDALERQGKRFDREALNTAYVQTYDIRKNGFRMEPVTTPRIPREWRATLGDDDMPVGLILPPGSDLNTLGQHHREMRELQRRTAESLPGVGVILPGSDNILYSAQPADPALVASRCLRWVQSAVYEKPDAPATGPLFDRIETHFNAATVYFKPGTAVGLRAKDAAALAMFEVAGVEGEYVPAEAWIEGETIRVQSDQVPRVVHVRYNWNQRPDQGLVNALGLPAIPFRSQDDEYQWFVRNDEEDLPEEYRLPASEWAPNDVTLISGHLKTHGYNNFTGWLGPLGVRTGPFGPNMGVREVKAGSPAEGKVFEGDMIYSANGQMLGEKAWEVMAAAITESETRAAHGKLVLGLRRGRENLEVELTLEVMGSYSPTAPYDCPKTEKIIRDLEDWVVAKGAGSGFLNTDALFLLATGNPALQGYVRRIVYNIMDKRDPLSPIEPTRAGKSWHNSAEAILLGEYYLATGDRAVLPWLQHACDRLAATQNPLGGWRHNYPGGDHYGLIPNAGLPGVMGLHFAKVAGLAIDQEAYALGIHHFKDGQADTGHMIYGLGVTRDIPKPLDPAAMADGKLETYNGGLSAAGILMGFTDNYRAAHLCSLISAYAWNNTFGGHGGNFWNNFWTPLGAHAHSKEAYLHFWQNHRWYRESNRMFDGSLIQHESGKVGAGTGVALVAPRRRLQIVGAPKSPFAADAPASLAPALEAYHAREYSRCAELVDALLAAGTVGKDDLPTVEALGRAAREIQQSIAADLRRMQELAEAGKPDEARSFLASLEGVMPKGDARLATIKAAIASAPQADSEPEQADTEHQAEQTPRTWTCLVTEVPSERSKDTMGKVPPEEASLWAMRVLEDLNQAPEGWMQPAFDDSDWPKTHLPISWRMYHTALLRTTFNVEDKDAWDGLRFRAWLFRQQNIRIYLNGELIGKVNNLEKKTGNVDAEFKESALKHLREGENTLALTTRHNWRWGMLFMRVYNDGFGFRLDARKALR